jgi:hypothetical protein
MSSQTKPSIPLVLNRLHHDLLLYLCDFLDAASILNFSLTCKKSHQLINENEMYWKLRYYREFALDEDWREVYWLSECSGQTAPKQPTSQPKTLEQKATHDWSYINWRKAYYRRQMIYEHLINGYWHKRYCDLPVDDPKTASLYIMGMSAWATLIGENNRPRKWVLQHDIAPLGYESEQLVWRELPQFTDIVGKILRILDVDMANRYIVMRCIVHFPVKSNRYDQFSSEDIYQRKAIIVWDAKDMSRMIIPYVQQDDEAKNNAPLPESMDFYMCWGLGFTELASDSQPYNTGYRYFVYDLKRGFYYSFGPFYTASHAYIQYATKDYAQVIVLHLDSDNMVARHENFATVNDKPAGLRIHWHSYIFDDKYSTSLGDDDGEIIVPYCANPMIHGQTYGPGLSLIMIYDAKGPSIHSKDTEPDIMLTLVRVPDHSLPQNSISRHRRSRYDGAIGKVIWIRPITTSDVCSVYSQNLIVAKQDNKIDILSGTDGKIVRQLDCTIYDILRPIIGPYFHLLDRNNNNLIVNIETGEIFQRSTKLLSPKKYRTEAFVKGVHDPSPTDWPIKSPFTQYGWPFCTCIGKLATHEPRHRNRFYLYSLSGF